MYNTHIDLKAILKYINSQVSRKPVKLKKEVIIRKEKKRSKLRNNISSIDWLCFLCAKGVPFSECNVHKGEMCGGVPTYRV